MKKDLLVFQNVQKNLKDLQSGKLKFMPFAKSLQQQFPELYTQQTDSVRRTIEKFVKNFEHFKEYYKQREKEPDIKKIQIKTKNEVLEISADEYKEALHEVSILRKKNDEKDKKLKLYQSEYNSEKKLYSFLESVLKKETPKFNIPKFEFDKTKDDLVCCAVISDLHYDEFVNKQVIGGINEYNRDVAKNRLWKYLKASLREVEVKRSAYNLKELNIFFLGDMLSGTIHDELIETNETTPSDALFELANILTQFVEVYLKHFEKVNIYTAYGNHGRLSQKWKSKNTNDNFDWILYNILQIKLDEYIKRGQLKITIPKSCWAIAEVCGHKILYSHGDDIRSYFTISFYNVEKRISNLKEMYGDFKYWIFGHFHTTSNFWNVYTNGSVVGMSELSAKKYRYTEPEQYFFTINKEYGIKDLYPIKLKNAKENEFETR